MQGSRKVQGRQVRVLWLHVYLVLQVLVMLRGPFQPRCRKIVPTIIRTISGPPAQTNKIPGQGLTMAQQNRLSRELSYLLRHGAQRVGLPIRSDGYVNVEILACTSAAVHCQSLSIYVLVATPVISWTNGFCHTAKHCTRWPQVAVRTPSRGA